MRAFLVFMALLLSFSVFAQEDFNSFLKPSDSINKERLKAVCITEAVLTSATLIGLNELWYKDYPRSNFHTINDFDEWLQMDKIGHVFSSYQLARIGFESMKWSGADDNHQYLNSILTGMTMLTMVEVLDGFSSEWGFSWYDMAANTIGTGLFIGQEKLWGEQRIHLKYSFSSTEYSKMNPDKLGANSLQEIFKDYNGQTYWLSANMRSFFKNSKIPHWLNVAFGYGADGMLTGITNNSSDFESQNRSRQYYISLDIDLSRINTRSRFLKTLFSTLNFVKIPLPTVEFRNQKRAAFHLLFF